MNTNYGKKIKISDDIHLNIIKKGVSASFGVRGASIKNGTYRNTGVPGTGIYSRQNGGRDGQKAASSSNSKSNSSDAATGCLIISGIVIIIGLFIYKLVSGQHTLVIGLISFALLFIIALIVKRGSSKEKKIEQSIQSQIDEAQNALNKTSHPIKKTILQNFIACTELSRKADETEAIIEALKKKIEKKNDSKLKAQLEKYETELLNKTKELENIQLDVDNDLNEAEKSKYSDLCENFEKILSCKKIWLEISSKPNTTANSSFKIISNRKEINFEVGIFNYIKSSFDISVLRDLEGNSYYIYPRYIIKAQSFANFEVFPIDAIDFKYKKQLFIENEDKDVPGDTVILDYTYKYVDKKGEPDRSYADNPRRTRVHYGEIEIKKFGLTYQISNYSAANDFVNAWNLLQNKTDPSIQNQIDEAQKVLNQTSHPIKKEMLQNFITCVELSRKISETEALIKDINKKTEQNADSQLQSEPEKYKTELLNKTKELENVQLDADKDLDDAEKWQYYILCENFEKILSCKKIWFISSIQPDTEKNSSSAILVRRKEIDFGVGKFNYIKSSFDIPVLRDLAGNSYYIYPRYIIKAQSFTDFEVFPIETVNVKNRKQRFIENESEEIPEDAIIVDYPYKYVDEKGEPDKNYSTNPRCTRVEYGKIEIEKIGLTYYISNYSAANDFVNTYNLWQKKISSKKIIPAQGENRQHNITEEYFNEINESIEKLVSFHNKLKQDNDFLTKVKRQYQFNETIKESNIVYTLFCKDLKTSYDMLDIPVDFSAKEGLGFSIFSKRVLGIEPVKYHQLDRILKIGGEGHKEVLNLLNSLKWTEELRSHFRIADLLSEKDSDAQKQYIVLMYRFASITAKADGIVTETEQKWLSELLKSGNIKEEIESANSLTENKEKKVEVYSTLKSDSRAELQSLIGLASVKTEISTLTNFVKIQQEREAQGLKVIHPSYHCVFTGSPGTGKTTVARIVAEIYKELGILKQGHLVETDRSGLVAEYVGQTAIKTHKLIDSALNGVLFIDEAYSLVEGGKGDYGHEAISTLLKRMEDNRDCLVVILAGYPVEMQKFINSNPGLQSRFNRYIEFPDYSADELFLIFESNLKKFDYMMDNDDIISLKEFLIKTVKNKDKNFGNARFVRNLFEKTIEQQANRLSSEVNLTNEQLSKICAIDILM